MIPYPFIKEHLENWKINCEWNDMHELTLVTTSASL